MVAVPRQVMVIHIQVVAAAVLVPLVNKLQPKTKVVLAVLEQIHILLGQQQLQQGFQDIMLAVAAVV